MENTVEPLSAKQSEMLGFIRRFVAARGYPPSYEEIRAGLGLCSKSHVNHYLEQLEAAGYITREAGRPRTIAIVVR